MKRLLTFALLAVLFVSFGSLVANAQDLPGASANLQTIPAGSLVIPMDNINQAVVTPFNLKAYGLVDKLLQNGVPAMWAIRAGKAKDGVDFTASAKRLYPSALASANVNFAGGPFIVHRDLKYLVGTIISTFGNSVAVYELTADATVDVRYVDAFKPRIFIGNKNSGIHSALYDFALVGKQPTGPYVIGATASDLEITETACFTYVSQPHTGTTDAVLRTKQFVQSGGNYLAECLALATFENDINGRFQTTTGLTINNVSTLFNYPNADMAFAQFIGTVDPAPGGSEQDWSINAAFANNGHILLQNSGADSNKYAATAAKLYNAGRGGMTFYLGAHNYGAGGTDATLINGQRMILNGVFVPPTRPSSCNLGFPGTTGYKSVKVTNDATGDGFPSAGDTLTWTITYPNIGSAPITNFQIAEILPAGVTLVGLPTVTLSGTGTTATVNPSYLGTAGSPNLFSAGAVLGVDGKIVVNIQTTINAGFVGTLSNQTTASGTGLPAAGVKSDNIDSATTGLLGGTTVPVSSATQTQNSASVDPTTLQVFVPLMVKLQSASAIRTGKRVKIKWESAFESDNLGYNVYRQDSNGLNLVTRSLIAGSALRVAGSRVLNSGFSYSTVDENADAGGSYWLEDVDMNGSRTLHGPIIPLDGKYDSSQESPSIEELNNLASVEDQTYNFPAIQSRVADADANFRAVSRTNTVSDPARFPKQSWVVANSFAKVTVKHNGWYMVSRSQLEAAGLPTRFKSAGLRLFVNAEEQSIHFTDNGDVYFFGRALDTAENGAQVYWLIANGRPAPRDVVKDGATGKPNADFFMNAVESKNRSIYASGILNGDVENFYSAVISRNGFSQDLSLKSLAANIQGAKVRVAVQGLSDGDHIVQVAVNGSAVGTIYYANTENSVSEFDVDASLLREGANTISLQSLGAGYDFSALESVRLTYPRKFAAENGQLSFGIRGGVTAAIDGFASPKIRVFDVTNPSATKEIIVDSFESANGFAFSLSSSDHDRVLFSFDDSAQLANPASVNATTRSTLHDSKRGGDLLVIAKSQFLDAVQPLVELRRAQGLRIVVAKAEDIFDEYGFGVENSAALKNFIVSTQFWQRAPRYVLLVGDSTYDPRNYLGNGVSTMLPSKLIDTSILETSSDDYFGDLNGDRIPELAIGRLPVRTIDELNVVVSKIANYERNRFRDDRKAILVSDRNFDNFVELLQPPLQNYGALEVIQRGGDDTSTRRAILDSLNQGADVVDFIGHGSVTIWMSGSMFSYDDAFRLTNQDRLSLFMLQSCMNGYSLDAYSESLAEGLLKAPAGGAFAVIASSGVNNPEGQAELANAFYGSILENRKTRLGDALLKAKKANVGRDVMRTTQLFGDPTSMLR
jgi:uncharacterized repeat protein (TIGR01451 family)